MAFIEIKPSVLRPKLTPLEADIYLAALDPVDKAYYISARFFISMIMYFFKPG